MRRRCLLAGALGGLVGRGEAQPAGIREACRQFVERRDLVRPINFGEYWNWTVIDNKDGTYSVGARYAAGQRNRYSTCVIRHDGGSFELVTLSRIL